MSSAEEASASAPPGGSVSVVVSEGLQLLLPLAGLFDVAKELQRLEKQKAKVRRGACRHGVLRHHGTHAAGWRWRWRKGRRSSSQEETWRGRVAAQNS